MLQTDVDDLHAEVEVLVVETEQRQIEIVLLFRRLEPRRRSKRVIGFLNTVRADVGTRHEVVELAGSLIIPKQLLGDLNGPFVFARVDQHERLVVSGNVGILVARSRRAELTGRIGIKLRATEQHPRFEPARRISRGQSIQQ